jgi:ABC-type sugar transport system ATPase subunit
MLPKSTDASLPKSFAFAELRKVFRDIRGRRAALDGVSFSVGDGETFVVLGPSGAGKTTLLRVLAGLERADGGSIQLDGRDITSLPAHKRRIAMVFQDDALFPHLSIRENLRFAGASEERMQSVARALDIDAHVAERPARLSGGERQRAALARAVLSDPRVLLLDEPFAHLDPQLREHVRRQFAEFRKNFSGAAIHVTHDHVEALAIADRLAIMIDGRFVQHGTPREVYDFPANIRVARFFGSPAMNLLNGEMEIAGIRPEHVRLDDTSAFRGRVIAHEYSGADTFVRIATPRGEMLVRCPAADTLPAADREVGIDLPPAFVRRFNRTTGDLLG